MIDKMIHKNELKLRLLITNACNQNCAFCLNDFQPKPVDHSSFMHLYHIRCAIDSYVHVMKEHYPLQVYFSGGEPTLYPYLPQMMEYAHDVNCRVTLNTNGTFTAKFADKIFDFVDYLHVGTYTIQRRIVDIAQFFEEKHQLQAVYSTKYPYIDKNFLDFYLNKYNLSLKIFQDFHEDPAQYMEFMNEVKTNYPNKNISFRYTGIQENRGQGCKGCDTKCITLRAAWVFPDGGISPCPQEIKVKRRYPTNYPEWINCMEWIRWFHRT